MVQEDETAYGGNSFLKLSADFVVAFREFEKEIGTYFNISKKS